MNKTVKVLLWILGGFLAAVVLMAGCVAAVDSSLDEPGSGSVGGSTGGGTSTTPEPSPTPKAKDEEDKVSFGDGTYEVGVDIQPGKYVSSGAKKGLFEVCMATWEPASGDSLAGDMQTANVDEQIILEVGSDGMVEIVGCEPLTKR